MIAFTHKYMILLKKLSLYLYTPVRHLKKMLDGLETFVNVKERPPSHDSICFSYTLSMSIEMENEYLVWKANLYLHTVSKRDTCLFEQQSF